MMDRLDTCIYISEESNCSLYTFITILFVFAHESDELL